MKAFEKIVKDRIKERTLKHINSRLTKDGYNILRVQGFCNEDQIDVCAQEGTCLKANDCFKKVLKRLEKFFAEKIVDKWYDDFHDFHKLGE